MIELIVGLSFIKTVCVDYRCHLYVFERPKKNHVLIHLLYRYTRVIKLSLTRNIVLNFLTFISGLYFQICKKFHDRNTFVKRIP